MKWKKIEKIEISENIHIHECENVKLRQKEITMKNNE